MALTGSTAKLKYFEENNGWTERKPVTIAPPTIKNVTVCNVDLHHSDMSDIDRFNELLAANLPTVALLHNVTPAALSRLKSGITARKMYSLLETSRAELHEECTVAFLRVGLQCELTEAPMKPEGKNILRALIQVCFRVVNGPTFTVTILHMEQNATQQRRLMVASAVLKQTANVDVSMLISNVMEGIQHSDEVYKDIQNTWLSQGYVDSIEEAMEKGMSSPWVVWTRSAKYGPASPSVELMRGSEPRYLSCSIVPRTAAGAGQGSITIPMPRSAKSARPKSPSSAANSTTNQPVTASAQQLLTDPAILSAEATKGSAPVTGGQSPSPQASGAQSQQSQSGNDIIMRLIRQQQQQQQQQLQLQQQQQQQQQQQHKWQLIHSFNLKGSEAKLSNFEGNFDVSHLFSSASDAVDTLNSGALAWPADYCIVHNTVLCSLDIPHLDRQMLRRYARDSKNNAALASQITASINNYLAATRGAGSPNNNNAPGSVNAGNGVLAGPSSLSSPPPSVNNSSPTAGASGAAGEKLNAWSKPMRAEAEEYSAFARHLKRDDGAASRREWSEACCTIVYQLTPRDFKFNITHVVGLSKENLKKAVYLLNRGKGSAVKDPNNPLQDYPYDYALLFSVERQGYWLIAATHVPCDIVACRMVA